MNNVNTDHIAELRWRIQAMETELPPAPWKQITRHDVDGLKMVGFAENSDLLLIVSTRGRELLDCITGEGIVRDDNELSWHNWAKLSAKGIGSLNGRIIRLAGVYGGGLNTVTKEGWHLLSIAPIWPDYRVILCPPQVTIQSNLTACVQVQQADKILAFGFSETGRSFIIAQNHTLSIYARE